MLISAGAWAVWGYSSSSSGSECLEYYQVSSWARAHKIFLDLIHPVYMMYIQMSIFPDTGGHVARCVH